MVPTCTNFSTVQPGFSFLGSLRTSNISKPRSYRIRTIVKIISSISHDTEHSVRPIGPPDMPDHLGLSASACEDVLNHPDLDRLRSQSRPPNPYHRQISELLEPSIRYAARRRSPPPTDSGTEADDEHFLKGLPAPRRLHKGLRGRSEASSGASTPYLATPAPLDHEDRPLSFGARKGTSAWIQTSSTIPDKWKRRRARETIRRFAELLIIGILGICVYANTQVRPILQRSSRGK